MIHEKGLYKKYVVAGPGGINCGCCFPQTNPARKQYFKSVKKSERMQWKKDLREELSKL